jgi:uncharacterized protein (UPF0548 family)
LGAVGGRVIRLRRPSAREIAAVLGSSARSLSYAEEGLTGKLDAPGVREAITGRYDLDRHAFTLGRGRALFDRARAALVAWRQFEIPWLQLHGAAPVVAGQIVATSTCVAGLWFLNPCRVVYTDFGDPDSVAYAYGTMEGHEESGEERFRVTFDATSEEVSYKIVAFSRPATILTKLAYPFARRLQKRFAASSAEALIHAVTEIA